MPDKENCGNFERLYAALGQPFNSLRAPEWVDAGLQCAKICGEIRRECCDACDPKRTDEQEKGERSLPVL